MPVNFLPKGKERFIIASFLKTGKELVPVERKGQASPGRQIAFCAMMAALGTVIMLTGGLIPVLTYCSPLLASILLIPVLDQHGRGRAWMVWAVTGALSMIIGVDKEAAFFYLFLGWYPILKPVFDAIPSHILRFAAKLLVFSAAIGLMYALIFFVFQIGEIMESFSGLLWINLLFFIGLAAVMMLYDRLLVGMWVTYYRRFRRNTGSNP